MKKLISAVLCIVMIISAMPATILAEDNITRITIDSKTLESLMPNDTMFEYISTDKKDTEIDYDKVKQEFINKFSDVSGNEWFVDYMVIPYYYGVINGYEDGTLRPNDYVRPCEVVKMFATCFNERFRDTNNCSGYLGKDLVWYGSCLSACRDAMPYGCYTENWRYYTESVYMKRDEIAYMLARYMDYDSKNLIYYRCRVANDYLGALDNFSDCKNIKTMEYMTRDEMITYFEHKMDNAAYSKMPTRNIAALQYAVEKGLFNGNGDGTLSPMGKVTRAELVKLLVELCRVIPDYTNIAFRQRYANKSTVLSNITAQKEYDEWISRGNITARWDDPDRPRLKAGDTFIAKDGKSYYLQGSGIYVGDTEIIGVGLPIACDLGRASADEDVLEHSDRCTVGIYALGHISSDICVWQDNYLVNPYTNEGHFRVEWYFILKDKKPTVKGQYHGELSPDKNFIWNQKVYDELRNTYNWDESESIKNAWSDVPNSWSVLDKFNN